MRQIRGSSNLKGSEAFHILTGHLSHQIEHHLFPDIPARRYSQIAPKVEAVCKKYGLNYNNASFVKQFGEVVGRIFKYALPFKKWLEHKGELCSPLCWGQFNFRII